MTAATHALTPIATPPQPGTAVNSVARDIASRMKRMLSIGVRVDRLGRGHQELYSTEVRARVRGWDWGWGASSGAAGA